MVILSPRHTHSHKSILTLHSENPTAPTFGKILKLKMMLQTESVQSVGGGWCGVRCLTISFITLEKVDCTAKKG